MEAAQLIIAQAADRARRDPSWLCRAADLTLPTLQPLLPFYLPLAGHIAAKRAAQAAPLVVGIQGPQGAGKSTLTQILQTVLRDVANLSVASLSIDDLYLTRAEREELARAVHPLFRTRGVPGTHDVMLGTRVLSALQQEGTVAVPRFDKGRDDRAPEATWPAVAGPCDVVLFEGLWIGVPPIPKDALAAPINDLEAREDPAYVWRSYANRALAERYPALFAPCQLLVHLAVPDFARVKRWRSSAEHRLRARLESEGADTSRVMDNSALARFFDHYERFTLHAMATLPALADVVLTLDGEHRVVGMRGVAAGLAAANSDV